ncbi:MAG: radical SAM protein [Parcubacteria group bacterium]
MSLDQRKDLLKQASELGCQTVKISGAGEPLVDSTFNEMVQYANDLGMWVISFTNGFVIDAKRAKELAKLDLSLIVKCNSFDPEVEDKLTGRAGYAEKRNKALKYLMAEGFNKGKYMRLGMDAVITKLNIGTILESLRYCRQNNIFPIFRPMMPIGGAKDKEEWQISKEETISLYEKAREIDRKEFDIDYKLALPYMGGTWCRQLNYALYINILGEVYSCTGSKTCFANIKDKPLKEIWNSSRVQQVKDTPYDSCPMRERYWRGEEDYDCV